MSKLNCEIITYGNSGHNQQILTGYFLLKQQGLINLKSRTEKISLIDTTKVQHLQDVKKYHLKVVIDHSIILYYDLHDSYEIDMDVLNKVDIYFKRSYLKSYIDTFNKDESNKVIALGMNYWIYPNSIDIDNIKRSLGISSIKEKISFLLKAFNLPSIITNSPKLEDIEELPNMKNKKNKKILFMARTWDPYDNQDRSLEKINERKEINEVRANCIRALKKEFGNDFQGGFSSTKYTIENYKDCIFPEIRLTTKNKYLEYLKKFPICIASNGLHSSIGWKFGEYVAMSKAIVSEKLIYTLPGNFSKEKNYMEFKTPDECVEQTLKLYRDDNKRFSMMNRNAEYYYHYLKPDSLVINSILKAIELK